LHFRELGGARSTASRRNSETVGRSRRVDPERLRTRIYAFAVQEVEAGGQESSYETGEWVPFASNGRGGGNMDEKARGVTVVMI
jgi:hypothetical protein